MAATADLANVPAGSISQIASQYSIPPSILQAVLRQGDSGAGDTMAGMSPQAMAAMGVDPSMTNDPQVIAAAAAASLSQAFNQYGDWQQALSQYLSGNPNDYNSPTSAVGGVVWSILGSASANPSAGMTGFKPANQTSFSKAAGAFTDVLGKVFAGGGVATQGAINNWHETSQAAGGVFGDTTIMNALQAAPGNHAQGYSLGQCAWYAAQSLGYIPGNLGNAYQWADRAAQQGMTVNHTPTVGSAVVWGANQGGAGGFGHVAVVEAVNPDGTFTVSEMNVDGVGVADTRKVITQAGVLGFIQPPAGTNMASAVPGLHAAVKATVAAQPAQHQKQPAGGTSAQSGIPDAPTPTGPSPSDVHQFAQQLKGAGIDPGEFAANFPQFAAMRRRLMQMNSNPGDYAKAVNELRSLGQPVTDQALHAYLTSQPHPTYPDLTVGAFNDGYGMAMLHSIPALGRTPHAAEVARLASAGANWTQTQQFYASLSDNTAPDVSSRAQPSQGAQQQPKLSVQQGGQQGPQGQQPNRAGGALA